VGIFLKLVLVVGLLAQSPGGDWFEEKVIGLDTSKALADPAMDFAVGPIADQIGLVSVVPFIASAVALVMNRDQKHRANVAFFPLTRLIKGQLGFGGPFPVAKHFGVAGDENFPAYGSPIRKLCKSHLDFSKWHESCPNQLPSNVDVFGYHRPFVGQANLGFKLECSTSRFQNCRLDRNRYPRALGLPRYLIRLTHGLGRFTGIFNGLSGQVDLPEQPNGSERSNESPNHRPECSASSGVCGLPLGAKIALTPILALFAWICQDRFLDNWWALGRDRSGRKLVRSRRHALGWFTLSILLFAAVFAVWLWGSTTA